MKLLPFSFLFCKCRHLGLIYLFFSWGCGFLRPRVQPSRGQCCGSGCACWKGCTGCVARVCLLERRHVAIRWLAQTNLFLNAKTVTTVRHLLSGATPGWTWWFLTDNWPTATEISWRRPLTQVPQSISRLNVSIFSVFSFFLHSHGCDMLECAGVNIRTSPGSHTVCAGCELSLVKPCWL